MASDKDALGATENFWGEAHLGSFCISISNFMINQKYFVNFWNNYRRTDVRPKVIKRGEMGLSRILKKCIRSQDSFGALYDIARYNDFLNQTDNIIQSLEDIRVSEHHWKEPWSKITPKMIFEDFISARGIIKLDKLNVEIQNDFLQLKNKFVITSYDLILEALDSEIITPRDKYVNDLVQFIRGLLSFSFIASSQIHQNPTILVSMGLPIIKLDGLYRGFFAFEDLSRLQSYLSEDDGKLLYLYLTRRPYGADALTGWKRAAFSLGLI